MMKVSAKHRLSPTGKYAAAILVSQIPGLPGGLPNPNMLVQQVSLRIKKFTPMNKSLHLFKQTRLSGVGKYLVGSTCIEPRFVKPLSCKLHCGV